MNKISAVMITKNAEARLDSVLASLSFCDDLVIVDSQSTDATLDIAKKFKARIFQRDFSAYSQQKQFAVDQAVHDWVLVIDADEVVSPKLREAILTLSLNADLIGGYELKRELYFLGARLIHSGGVDYPLRLFHQKKGKFNNAAVHERIEVQGQVSRIEEVLQHYSYDSLEEYFQKFNKYTSFAAEDLLQEYKKTGLRPARHKIFTSFPVIFIKLFFIKLGFLEGARGFLWCLFSALSPVVKYAKFELALRYTKPDR